MSKADNGAQEPSVFSLLKRVMMENGRAHIGSYTVAILCLMTVALTTGLLAAYMKTVVNVIFESRGSDLIWVICGSIFAIFALRGFATYGQAVALSKVGNHIVADYQRRIFKHLTALSVGYYSGARSAQLTNQIGQNISGIRDILNLTITSLARDALTLIVLVGVMIYQEPVLAAIVFVVAPPLVLALRGLSRRLRNATHDSITLNARVMGAMQETVQGIAIVKAFTMESALENKIDGLIAMAERRSNSIARLSERTAPLTESFAGLAIASVVGYAAYRSAIDHQMPGALFSFIAALLMAYDPAKRLARLQVQIERAYVNAKMIYAILDTVVPLPDRPGAKSLSVDAARIEFRNVHFSYPGSDEILKGVSFIAEGGKTTAIVGPSGAGKSTIINLVPRFHDPIMGSILIDGQDIAEVSTLSLRQNLAYVSQQPYLFEGTIADNIRYGRPGASDADVEQAARLAHAHDFIVAQPQGYCTQVGENGSTLSGGQRQRLSIARALIRDCPILLLDEATSSLDNESESAVQKALDHAMRGRTVVVIVHRLSTIVGADSIIVVDGGHVIEQGTHQSLVLAKSGLYARLNNLQTRDNAQAG